MDTSDALMSHLHDSSSSSSPPPLISLDSILPLESFSNFPSMPSFLDGNAQSSLPANLNLTLNSLCANYRNGIRLLEEILRTARAKIEFASEFSGSEDALQIEYFESLLGAVEQNITLWQSQYDSSIYPISAPNQSIYLASTNSSLPLTNQPNPSFSLLFESSETIPIIQQGTLSETLSFPRDHFDQFLVEQQQLTGLNSVSTPLSTVFTENHNCQMLVESNENIELNNYVFENDPGAQMPVALTNQTVLSDISNTHHFLQSPANLDVESELSQLFDDPPDLSISDPLIDMITQEDNSAVGLPFASSSMLGAFDNQNTILMDQNATIYLQNTESIFTAESVPYTTGSLETNSILSEALTGAAIDRDNLHQHLALIDQSNIQHAFSEPSYQEYLSAD